MGAVSEITGLARRAIDRGGKEMACDWDIGEGRVCRPGGGRKKLTDRDPTLLWLRLRAYTSPADAPLATQQRDRIESRNDARNSGRSFRRASFHIKHYRKFSTEICPQTSAEEA